MSNMANKMTSKHLSSVFTFYNLFSSNLIYKHQKQQAWCAETCVLHASSSVLSSLTCVIFFPLFLSVFVSYQSCQGTASDSDILILDQSNSTFMLQCKHSVISEYLSRLYNISISIFYQTISNNTINSHLFIFFTGNGK